MKAAAAVEVLNCEAVILLMGEKTHHPPATERNCGLAQHHRHSAYLLAFLSEGDVLNGTDAHLRGWASTPLKLHDVALNS